MRKWIALLLSVLAVFSTVSVASAAFSDQSQISKNFTEAVDAMSEKGIIGGFPDGTFQPKGTLTRAQAAKILCVTMLGAEKANAIAPAAAGFTDVPDSHWAAKFVNYCAAEGIVAGVGSGKFNPDGKLTDVAFGKMLLVTYGHKAEAEGLTGAGWDENTKNLLKKEGRDHMLNVTGGEMTREQACQMAYNFTKAAADTSAYADVEIKVAAEKDLFKTFGRTNLTETGLSLDFAGSAVEFEADFGGTLSMLYNAETSCYFTCFIDGEEALHTMVRAAKNKKVTIAKNVYPGTHTVRIVRESDASKTAELMEFVGITFNGNKASMKAPADKSLLIEFVGDSITAGKYTQMDMKEDAIHRGTNSYAYLTAKALDADYSMLCRGGCGYFKVSTCPRTMNELYPYYNGFAETPVAYTAPRKADVVVIAMGTNDSAEMVRTNYENGTVPFPNMEAAMTDLVNQVRAMHGSDVKIILMYNMMAGSWQAEFNSVASRMGLYTLKTARDNKGGNNHPSIEGHKTIANELITFLNAKVLK